MEQQHNGFWGRLLRVDLTAGAIRGDEISPVLFRRYLGGRNLALHYLLKETLAGVEPLGPDNPLIVMTSVVTGA